MTRQTIFLKFFFGTKIHITQNLPLQPLKWLQIEQSRVVKDIQNVRQQSPLSSSRTFSAPQTKNPYSLNSYFPFLLSSKPAPGNYQSALFLQFCPFCIFHLNEPIQHVAFYVWLLSLSMFSSFIQFLACISTSFFFIAE